MPEKVAPGPVHDAHCIREAVCIDTKKIFDSCKEEDIAPLSNPFSQNMSYLITCECKQNKPPGYSIQGAYFAILLRSELSLDRL